MDRNPTTEMRCHKSQLASAHKHKAKNKHTMTGFIDFNTDCPWQLYTFSFFHLLFGVICYTINFCPLAFPNSPKCTESELVMQRYVALTSLYTGVLFTTLTYHSKTDVSKATRLASFSLVGSATFLTSVIFCGNASFGGFERSWMHIGDMIGAMALFVILGSRVDSSTEWAEKKELGRLGLNCKSLLLLFLPITAVKFLAMTDFISPTKILADGVEMTELARWMFNYVAVLVLNIIFGLLYSVLYDDDKGHELVVIAIAFMTVVSPLSFQSLNGMMGSWTSMHILLIRAAIILCVCISAIVGGRRGVKRAGYEGI